MKDKTKTFFWKLKQYLKFIVIEPWVTKFSFPNIKTISLTFVFISLLLRNFILIWISFGLYAIIHSINEFKSGQFIYLMRNRKFKDFYDIKRKIRKDKKNNQINQENSQNIEFLETGQKQKDLNSQDN